MSLTNNTGSRVTSNEEPLTGQSGPVNLASKMAPKEKSRKKGKKERRKTVEEINVESIRRINPPNFIQPDGYVERNLFLECLTANQPNSNPPLPAQQTGDNSTLGRRPNRNGSSSEQSTLHGKNNQQQGRKMSIEQDIDYGDRYRAWHDAKVKGTTKSTFQEWTEDGKRDRRLLSKSTGWDTGLNARKVVMGLNTESIVNITAENGIIPIVTGAPGIQPPPVLEGNGTEALLSTPQPSLQGRVDEDLSLLASPDLSPRLLDNSTLSDKDFIETIKLRRDL